MLKDITFGKYISTGSIVHKLDPRTKIFFCLLFSCYIFFISNFFASILVVFFLLSLIVLSKIRLIVYLKNIKPVIPILILTYISNILSTSNKDAFIKIWFFCLSKNAVLNCAVTTFRIIFLVMINSLISFTTTPIELKKSLLFLMRPLKIVKVPIEDVALTITLTLRLIPSVVEQANKVMDAQKIRGVNFSSKNIVKRTKNYIYIIIPILVSLLRQANDLATAMECRCYTGKNRTSFRTLKFKKLDIVFLFVVIFLFSSSIMLNTISGKKM